MAGATILAPLLAAGLATAEPAATRPTPTTRQVAPPATQPATEAAEPAAPSTRPSAPPPTPPAVQAGPVMVLQGSPAVPSVPPHIAEAIARGEIPPEVVAQMRATGQLPPDPNMEGASELVAAIQQRPFARPPAAVLDAVRDAGKSTETSASNEATTQSAENGADPATRAAAFEADVLAGRWDRVRSFLGDREPEEASAIYQIVIDKLNEAAQANSPEAMQMRARQRNATPTPAIVAMLPDEVLGLAGAFPHEPSEAHIDGLGRLLASALQQYRTPQTALEALDAGRGAFGGNQTDDRLRAADLLLAADLETEAGRFLPELDEATPPAIVNRHAHVLMAKGHAANLASAGVDNQELEDIRQLYEMYGWPVPADLGQPETPLALRPEHAQALALCDRVLTDERAEPADRSEAIERAMGLLDQVDRAKAEAFLARHATADQFADDSLLAALTGKTLQAVNGASLEGREFLLRMQARIARTLLNGLDGGDPDPRTQGLLRLFAQAWLAEVRAAEQTPSAKQQARDQGRANGSVRLRSPNGGYVNVSRRNLPRYRNETQALNDVCLLETAPADTETGEAAWLEACGEALRPALLRAMCVLLIRDEQFDEATDYLERLAAIEPEVASELARSLLSTWTAAANPNSSPQDPNVPIYAGSLAAMQRGVGIPLTRAKQARNLEQLRELLDVLHALPCDPPPAQGVIAAFIGAHSDAEVFRLEDITRIFGAAEALDAGTLRELLSSMRTRLAEQWRSLQPQAQAGTRRDDEAIAAEVERGYDVLLDLAANAEGRDWQIAVIAAAARFDRNEFRYGRGIDLADYTAGRDAAFERFRAAADLYAAAVARGELARQAESVEPYMSWFLAALGTSDLAQLTRQQAPRTAEVDAVREAIAALAGNTATRHFDRFAETLVAQAATIPPQLKDRYLRAGLSVVGVDHPAASQAAELVRYYDDLLGEVALTTRLDSGSTTVGTEPFGVHVGVRHTESIGRESGGFGRYLAQSAMRGYPMPNLPPGDRDVFEQGLRESLTDSFEVLSITWHAADVEPRGDIAREPGWRYTPLAFVVLKARDPAADRVPPVRLDLSFRDTLGDVVLPVESSVLAIDARTTPSPDPESVDDLKVVETLDESKLEEEGALTLDVRVTATGLVPPIERLLDSAPADGWTLADVSDGGLVVTGLDLDGEIIRPTSERTWTARYERTESGSHPAQFTFPQPRAPFNGLVDATYQRYAGSDVTDVEPQIALATSALASPSRWPMYGVVAVLLAVVAGIAAYLFRRRRTRGRVDSRIVVPRDLTPFTLLTALRRLEAAGAANGDAATLARDIRSLEQSYFAKAAGDPSMRSESTTEELQPIARRWLA